MCVMLSMRGAVVNMGSLHTSPNQCFTQHSHTQHMHTYTHTHILYTYFTHTSHRPSNQHARYHDTRTRTWWSPWPSTLRTTRQPFWFQPCTSSRKHNVKATQTRCKYTTSQNRIRQCPRLRQTHPAKRGKSCLVCGRTIFFLGWSFFSVAATVTQPIFSLRQLNPVAL